MRLHPRSIVGVFSFFLMAICLYWLRERPHEQAPHDLARRDINSLADDPLIVAPAVSAAVDADLMVAVPPSIDLDAPLEQRRQQWRSESRWARLQPPSITRKKRLPARVAFLGIAASREQMHRAKRRAQARQVLNTLTNFEHLLMKAFARKEHPLHNGFAPLVLTQMQNEMRKQMYHFEGERLSGVGKDAKMGCFYPAKMHEMVVDTAAFKDPGVQRHNRWVSVKNADGQTTTKMLIPVPHLQNAQLSPGYTLYAMVHSTEEFMEAGVSRTRIKFQFGHWGEALGGYFKLHPRLPKDFKGVFPTIVAIVGDMLQALSEGLSKGQNPYHTIMAFADERMRAISKEGRLADGTQASTCGWLKQFLFTGLHEEPPTAAETAGMRLD